MKRLRELENIFDYPELISDMREEIIARIGHPTEIMLGMTCRAEFARRRPILCICPLIFFFFFRYNQYIALKPIFIALFKEGYGAMYRFLLSECEWPKASFILHGSEYITPSIAEGSLGFTQVVTSCVIIHNSPIFKLDEQCIHVPERAMSYVIGASNSHTVLEFFKVLGFVYTESRFLSGALSTDALDFALTVNAFGDGQSFPIDIEHWATLIRSNAVKCLEYLFTTGRESQFTYDIQRQFRALRTIRSYSWVTILGECTTMADRLYKLEPALFSQRALGILFYMGNVKAAEWALAHGFMMPHTSFDLDELLSHMTTRIHDPMPGRLAWIKLVMPLLSPAAQITIAIYYTWIFCLYADNDPDIIRVFFDVFDIHSRNEETIRDILLSCMTLFPEDRKPIVSYVLECPQLYNLLDANELVKLCGLGSIYKHIEFKAMNAECVITHDAFAAQCNILFQEQERDKLHK